MPSIYSYANKSALGLEHLSTYKRLDRQGVSFSKQKSRDNQMYNLTEGYRMDREEDSFLEKLNQLQLYKHTEFCSERRCGSQVKEPSEVLRVLRSKGHSIQLSNQIVTGKHSEYSDDGGGSITSELLSHKVDAAGEVQKINQIYKQARNYFKLRVAGSNQRRGESPPPESFQGMSLDARILGGYYKASNNR